MAVDKKQLVTISSIYFKLVAKLYQIYLLKIRTVLKVTGCSTFCGGLDANEKPDFVIG